MIILELELNFCVIHALSVRAILLQDKTLKRRRLLTLLSLIISHKIRKEASYDLHYKIAMLVLI